MFFWNDNKINSNIKAISTLLNPEYWNELAGGTSGDNIITGSLAIGSPTIEMWIASWNQVYIQDKISVNSTSNGYQIEEIGSETSFGNMEGYRNKLYFPYTATVYDSNGKVTSVGYWLSSPAASGSNKIYTIGHNGYAQAVKYNISNYTYSIRPVVYIPNTYKLQLNEAGNYDIIEK